MKSKCWFKYILAFLIKQLFLHSIFLHAKNLKINLDFYYILLSINYNEGMARPRIKVRKLFPKIKKDKKGEKQQWRKKAKFSNSKSISTINFILLSAIIAFYKVQNSDFRVLAETPHPKKIWWEGTLRKLQEKLEELNMYNL